jgi:hypothetical protein
MDEMKTILSAYTLCHTATNADYVQHTMPLQLHPSAVSDKDKVSLTINSIYCPVLYAVCYL